MSIISTATWLLPLARITDDQLVYMFPDVASMTRGTTLRMIIVLASPADSDVIVNLSSDQPTIVSVPASVTVPTGESEKTFFATSYAVLGVAVITATVVATVQSTLTVVAGAVGGKPRPVSAFELRPNAISAEKQ